MRRVLWVLMGSVVVSAACSVARVDDGPVARVVDAAADAVLDALGLDTSVADAHADTPPAPTPPTVDEMGCDVDGMWAGSPAWLAAKTYPGKSVAELSAVRALRCGATPSGEECETATMFISPGVVKVLCGPKTGDFSKLRIRFVTP